tara:strand:+ start:611 stop:781 length:171 start_codon:yes stop_codon:yes gene_type:complete
MILCDVIFDENTNTIHIEFYSGRGVQAIGTHELLDDYELTAEQLLDILQEWRDNNE